MKRVRPNISNRKGMTLLELLTGVGLVALIAAGIAGMNQFALRSARQLDQTSMALGLRNTFVTEIENGAAWTQTLAKNPEMECLRNQTVCTVTTPQTFDLYNEKGDLFYNAKSPSAGFTTSRAPCTDFPNKSSTCIFHFDLTWQALCPLSGDCLNPLVLVSAILKLEDQGSKEGASVMLDKNYSVQIFKSYAKTSIEANCLAVGGTFDPVTKNCKTKLSDTRCAPGLFVSGVDAYGNLLCSPAFSAKCDAGEVLSGIGPTGQPICTSSSAQFASTAPAVPATKPEAGSGPASKPVATPTPTPAPIPTPTPPTPTMCAKSFLGAFVDMSATIDEDVAGSASNVTISAPRRTVNLLRSSGNIKVNSAIEIPKIEGISGNIWVNANWVGSIYGVSGTICMNAKDVGSIDGGSGAMEIFANKIDRIDSQSGPVIVHAAKVGKFTKSSGNICLLDGATVGDVSGVSGKVVYKCN